MATARVHRSDSTKRQNRTWYQLRTNPAFVFGAGVLTLMTIGAIWGQVAPPYDPVAQDFSNRLNPPSLTHFLGTDRFGRDIFSRLLAGASPMLLVAAGATLLASVLGTPIGIVSSAAGRYGMVISRLLDGFQAFPGLVLSLLLVIIFGASYGAIVLAAGLAFFPLMARVTEAVVDSESAREYVQAAEAMGMHRTWILLLHILPNGASALIVQATTIFSLSILVEASLSFLGLGPQTLTPTWGRIVFDARSTMEIAPHTILAPLAAISSLVISVNLLGDALRDALDPIVSSVR